MIRKVKSSDLDRIFAIYSSYCIDRSRLNDYKYQFDLQKNGFLLGLDTKSTIKKLIESSELFLVDEDNKDIRGYIIFNKDKDYLDDRYKIWLNTSMREKYYLGDKTISVYEVAVAENHHGKGVAAVLLNKSEKILTEKGIKELFSIVTIAPITNCPSLLFHHRNGFNRIAVGKPRTLFNLKDYSSILFGKVL